MARRVPTIAAALALMCALLWGGCLACQPLLTRAKTAKGCCDPAGKCETPVPGSAHHGHCKSPALAAAQFVPVAPESVPLPAILPLDAEAGWSLAAAPRPAVREIVPTPSPPELYTLHSSFLI